MEKISFSRVTGQLLLARGIGYVLALGNSVIIARSLGAERLGSYAYAMGVAALFALLPNLGISTIVTRTIAQDAQAGGGVVHAAVCAQALLAVLLVIMIPALAALMPGQPVPLGYIGLAAAQLAVGTLSWPYLAVLSGRMRYDRVAVAEVIAGASGTVSFLCAVALRGGVTAFLWAHVLAAGSAVVVARWITAPFLLTHSTQRFRLGTLFRQATPFGAIAAVQSLYTRLDILFLGQMTTAASLGLYSAAYKPINMLVYFGITVAGALFPFMAQAPRADEMEAAFGRVLRGLAVAAPAMALLFSGLAGPMLKTLYGPEFVAAEPILRLLAWSAAANWLYAPFAIVLQARGQESWWLVSLTGGLVLNAVGNFWAIPRWGPLGAAAATLVSEVALFGSGIVWSKRRLGMSSALGPIVPSLGAAAAGGATLWFLEEAEAALALPAAFVVYGGLLFLFRIITAEDVVLAIGWFREVRGLILRA